MVIIASILSGCSSSYDAGSSPDEQLCDVLESTLDSASDQRALQFEPLLARGAADPSELPSELLPIALSYETNLRSYDDLGAYEAALRFAAALVELARAELIGPSHLTFKVESSASAIDDAIRGGACSS